MPLRVSTKLPTENNRKYEEREFPQILPPRLVMDCQGNGNDQTYNKQGRQSKSKGWLSCSSRADCPDCEFTDCDVARIKA